MRLRRPSQRHPAVMARADHQRLWRLVQGGVVDALVSHPDYLTDKGRHSAVLSITKRVVGQLVGHAKEAQARGRLGGCHGAAGSTDRAGAGAFSPASRAGVSAPVRTRRPALLAVLTGEGAA